MILRYFRTFQGPGICKFELLPLPRTAFKIAEVSEAVDWSLICGEIRVPE